MMTLKQLTGCKVYDENEKLIGEIRGVTFDKATGKCLLVTENGTVRADKLRDNDEGITAYGLQTDEQNYPTVTDKTAYDTLGRKLGVISDGIIGKTANIVKLIADNGKQFSRGRIAAVDDIVLIRIPKPTKKKEKPKEEHMRICANTQQNANAVDLRPVTRRRCGDFSFLIGKIADKNIINFYGEIMIKRGDKVTAEILRQAKTSGKLIELCLHVN